MRGWDLEEIWCTFLLMLFAMGGYVPIAMNGLNSADSRFHYDTAASSPVSRAVILLMIGGTLLPMVRQFRLLRYRRAVYPLLPYIAVAVASVAWSQDAEVSLRKLLSFLLTTAFAFYFAARFSARSQVRMVLIATSLLAVASVALVVLAPGAAVDHNQHAGAWQGVFAGKNTCAMVMAVGLAAAIVYRPRGPVLRCLKVCLMAMFAGIILMADSSSALVVIALLWISLPVLAHLARYQKPTRAVLLSLLFLAGSLLAIAVVTYLPVLLKLLNRDPTLTGRTDIWKAVLQSIFKHPLLGYGYGAFWLGLKGESANVVLAVKWAIPNAHNGFLDVWLSLGAVGLAAIGYALSRALRRIWRLLLSSGLRQNLWLICVVLLVLAYNMDESVLIAAPSLMWTLFAAAVCGLELQASTARARPLAAARTTMLIGTANAAA